MFIVQRKLKLLELQSVLHFLIVASSLSYGACSAQSVQKNLDGDPVARILGRGSRRPRQVEKLQNQLGFSKDKMIPRPILVLGEKKMVYISCQGSATIH
jgi:hypothetical protein